MNSDNFKRDLAVGHKAEDQFAALLKEKYGDEIVNIEKAPPVKFEDWDLKVSFKDGRVATYEVKADQKAGFTHNFFVEYGKQFTDDGEIIPSWISTSQADNYVYRIKWEFRAGNREEFLEKSKQVEKIETKWWDDGFSRWRLFKCKDLPLLFSKVELDGQRGEETVESTGEAG